MGAAMQLQGIKFGRQYRYVEYDCYNPQTLPGRASQSFSGLRSLNF
jgi:hypothetical protein